MVKVELYTKSYCPFCKKSLAIFDSLGVKYENFVIDEEPNGEEEYSKLKEKTEHNTVPQIFINDKFIGGCDDLFELHESKELDSLLKD